MGFIVLRMFLTLLYISDLLSGLIPIPVCSES